MKVDASHKFLVVRYNKEYGDIWIYFGDNGLMPQNSEDFLFHGRLNANPIWSNELFEEAFLFPLTKNDDLTFFDNFKEKFDKFKKELEEIK